MDVSGASAAGAYGKARNSLPSRDRHDFADAQRGFLGGPERAQFLALSPLPYIAVVPMILSPDGRDRNIGFTLGRLGAVLAVVVVVAVLSELIIRGEDGSHVGARTSPAAPSAVPAGWE